MTQAYVALIDGTLGIAEHGIAGYSPTNYKFDTYKDAKAAADKMNIQRGIDKRTALTIIASTMAERK